MSRLARVVGAAVFAGGCLAAVVGVLAITAHPRVATPAPSASAGRSPQASLPPAPARPALPDLTDPHLWAAWAVLDRIRQTATVGGDQGKSTTESMIKVAIGAEYLHQLETGHREPGSRERRLIEQMIRVSDNDAAETLYRDGGGDRMLQAVIATCRLTETTTKPGWWSETAITPADAAKMGACIADGKVTSPPWTAWLLDEMRHVDGPSRFGPVDVRPVDHGTPLAIKNGYTLRDYDRLWHVNCLAIADGWTMEIMMRYPGARGLSYGAKLCAGIAAAIIPADETPEPDPRLWDPAPVSGSTAPTRP